MTYSTESADREAFIAGLYALGDYLAIHPDLPVPGYCIRVHLIADSTDDGGRAQVDKFARQIDVAVEDTMALFGHYEAGRSFGPIDYRMAAISKAAMARHYAHESYSGCVTPDSDTWTRTRQDD